MEGNGYHRISNNNIYGVDTICIINGPPFPYVRFDSFSLFICFFFSVFVSSCVQTVKYGTKIY